MSRPTALYIDTQALIHNIACIKQHAPQQQVIAMVKANAYGCGMAQIVPTLIPWVDGFGVACIEEARMLRLHCADKPCFLLQGIFSEDEINVLLELDLTWVIHDEQQLAWLLANPLPKPIPIWVKVDTGMHRLGFSPEQLPTVTEQLKTCPWVQQSMGLMTHMACADEPEHALMKQQLSQWHRLQEAVGDAYRWRSMSNSAALMTVNQSAETHVRPGIMLYGVSPFAEQVGTALGLRPVAYFESALMSIHHYPIGATIGYGATWRCPRASIIGVVPVGYGDGYPRHIRADTRVWTNGCYVPIVGRVSMDMMTIDLSDCAHARIGDRVELWGSHVPIETVANNANTLAYELLCQITQRVIRYQQ